MSAPIQKVYVLDTNILFELSLWLPISLNKKFWDKFEETIQAGKCILLDAIMGEVKFDNNGLKKWCENQKGKGVVRKIDDTHRARATQINNLYKMIDETSARSTVDTYLIAYAEANKFTIFSREGARKNLESLYKIPDVCKILNIPIIRNPIKFFEAIDYKN